MILENAIGIVENNKMNTKSNQIEGIGKMFKLETPRLILRNILMDDAHTFMQYRNDPEVARYQSWLPNLTLKEIIAFITPLSQKKIPTPNHWNQIAITLKSNSQHIGDIAFKLSEDQKQGELGFTLNRSYQHQGYAFEAVSNFLDWIFDSYQLHRIFAICDTLNLGSINLLEKLHFRREGHFIKNIFFKGSWGDEYLYALLGEER